MGWGLWAFIIFVALAAVLPMGLMARVIWGTANLSYEVTRDEVVITFGPGETRIPLSNVTDVSIIDQPTRGRRIVGTSMPGLQEGTWSFEETGRITLYSTSTRPLTVIEAGDRKWGISPADPEGFRRAVEAREPAVFEVASRSSPNAAFGFLMLPLIVVFLVGGIIFYTLRVLKGIRYELGSDALLIHGGWSPIRVPYDKITHAAEASPQGLPWRTFGIGLPGLHWGSFSWRNAGPNLRIYSTRLRPLVLLRVGVQTIGISPADPEAFLHELGKRCNLD